jgi:hypothetical protein
MSKDIQHAQLVRDYISALRVCTEHSTSSIPADIATLDLLHTLLVGAIVEEMPNDRLHWLLSNANWRCDFKERALLAIQRLEGARLDEVSYTKLLEAYTSSLVLTVQDSDPQFTQVEETDIANALSYTRQVVTAELPMSVTLDVLDAALTYSANCWGPTHVFVNYLRRVCKWSEERVNELHPKLVLPFRDLCQNL